LSSTCRRVARTRPRPRRRRGDVAHAALDEPHDDGEGVETRRTIPGRSKRHQIDERDDVDELRQRLQDVVDRAQDLRDAFGSPPPDAERDADHDASDRRDEHLRERVHRERPHADEPDQASIANVVTAGRRPLTTNAIAVSPATS
jgi:hypothetical protein